MLDIQRTTALQQPEWSDPGQIRRVGEILASRPMLVRPRDVADLRALLTDVAAGQAHVIQAGDCAEDPNECTAAHLSRKGAMLDVLAGAFKMTTQRPVLRVGRLGGQFAKPRSRPTEAIDGQTLPVFRGHLVNGPEPTEESRAPDPLRLLTGYMAAGDVMEHLGWRHTTTRHAAESPVWTSHEALVLDYELPLCRTDVAGVQLLGSTHWPWIGERTRQVDGPHVTLLSRVSNPVACKIGPTTRADELLALCRRLDPYHEPGRLTLISRMGAERVGVHLPGLVEAVRAAGHPVIWMCDPMHGNTVMTPGGYKTRILTTLQREVTDFVLAVRAGGGVAGGLHLETTPDEVVECVADEADFYTVGARYTSLCDPRLTVGQGISLISAWPAEPTPGKGA